MGSIGWTENVAVSTLTKVVLEDDLGYEEVQIKGPLELGPLFQGTAGGALAAFQDVWLPNNQSYMDIQSLEELDQAGTDEITGIEPSASFHPVVRNEVIPGYHLDMKLVESSTAAMLSELDKKYSAKEPIVFLAWSPHWMNAEYDFHYLDDPKDLQGEFNDPSRITTVVNEDLPDEDPVAYAFLKAISLDEAQINQMEADINEAGVDDPEKGVRNWLEDNRDVVQPWIEAAKQEQ
jgi:glycine betaine/proline transport system substrate-binding protein